MSGLTFDPDALAEVWPITGVSIAGAVPTRWNDRQVFVIDCEQGTFAVKAFVPPPSDFETEHPQTPLLAVLPYLTDRGYVNSPRLLLTRTGDRLAPIGDVLVAVMEFVSHPLLPHRHSRARSWSEIGDAAARLNMHRDYPHPLGISIPAAIREVAELAAQHEFSRDLVRLLPRVAELENAECALIHSEIHENNVGRRADGSIVFLDMDISGHAPIALEYGYPLLNQFISEDDLRLDRATAMAFFDAYRDAGGVIDRELMFTASLWHALRYMWFHNTMGRWVRIMHAVDNEADLAAAVL